MKKLFLFTLFSILGASGAWAQGFPGCDGDPGSSTGCPDPNIPIPGRNGHDDSDPPRVHPDAGGNQNNQNFNSGDPVNTFTGETWETATDFNYPRAGIPMKLERYFHEGITAPNAPLGQNWMTNYDMCLYLNYFAAIPTQPTGFPDIDSNFLTLVLPHRVWKFTPTANPNVYLSPPGCPYRLTRTVGNTFVMFDKNGMNFTFSYIGGGAPNIARLTRLGDLNGNTVTISYQSVLLYWNITEVSENNFFVQSSSTVVMNRVEGPNWWIQFWYSSDGSTTNEHHYANPSSSRLWKVTNSVGDEITFSPLSRHGGPITQVSRHPSGLNAKYEYFSDVGANGYYVSSLKRIIDPLRPRGFKDTTYDCPNFDLAREVRPVRRVLNANGEEMFRYDYSMNPGGGRSATIHGPNGLLQTDIYDSNGNWVQKRFVVDGQPVTETYTWNTDELMTNFVDGNGHAVTMAYDTLLGNGRSLGNLTYRKDADGKEEFYTYTLFSRMLTSRDKNGVSRTYEYFSGNSNLRRILEPLGKITTFDYHPNGLLFHVTDANNHVTTYTYDLNGNPRTIQEPALGLPANLSGALSTYFFNDRGQLTSMTDPLQQTTTYLYTPNQTWLSDINYPDATNDHFEYDAVGNRTLFRDRNQTRTRYVYDAADRLTDVFEADGTSDVRHNQFSYDALGNPVTVTDGKNQRTFFIYNEQNLVRHTSDPLGKGYTNVYDGALNLRTTINSRGVARNMDYFNNDRLRTVSFSDGTAPIAFTYDGNGNRTSMVDGSGSVTYVYDALNRAVTVHDLTRNFILGYTYDLVGNRLTMTNNKVPGTVTYGYYENNLSRAVTDVDGMATTYVYDPMKNLKNRFYPNGASVTYSYVPTNHRLQTMRNLNSHGEDLARFDYEYDFVGNHNRVTDLTGPTSFIYDKLYQLKSAAYPGPRGTIGYGYDLAGNRNSFTEDGITRSLGHNSGNEITSGLDETFTHDQVGNMKTRVSSDGTTTYTWDGLNRLVNALGPSVNASYAYNGDNLRLKKVIPAGTINYFYDGLSVILETDQNDNILKHYNPGVSTTEVLPGNTLAQGKKLFYLYSGHGDVVGLMDGKQNLVQDYNYDAFGKGLGVSKDSNNYRYVGRFNVYSDDEIGLQYMWNRWYDPSLGRFVNRDPIGLKGGINLYSYGLANPLGFIDPVGTCSISSFLSGLGSSLVSVLGDVFDPYMTFGISYGAAGMNVSETYFSSTALGLNFDPSGPQFSYVTAAGGGSADVYLNLFQPTLFNFGSVAIGQSEYLSVYATNTGVGISFGLGLGPPVSYQSPEIPSLPIPTGR